MGGAEAAEGLAEHGLGLDHLAEVVGEGAAVAQVGLAIEQLLNDFLLSVGSNLEGVEKLLEFVDGGGSIGKKHHVALAAAGRRRGGGGGLRGT